MHNLRVHGLPVPPSLEDSVQTNSIINNNDVSIHHENINSNDNLLYNPNDHGAGVLLTDEDMMNNEVNDNTYNLGQQDTLLHPSLSALINPTNNNNNPNTMGFLNTPSPLTAGLIGNTATNNKGTLTNNRGKSTATSTSSSRNERSRSVA